jgi:hypothetical protein
MLSAFLFVAVTSTALFPSTLEMRYCYAAEAVPRNSDGTIKRSAWVREKFRQQHPCPATGQVLGPCVGWAVDHVIPLVCGGCDSVNNMQWLPATIKACAGTECKDRWEQRVYCR